MRVDLSLDNLNPDFLNESKAVNNYVEEDGFFRPAACLPQHKVAIIIPYRDREQHLHILLKHLHGVLQRQLLLYKVFVIEQVSSIRCSNLELIIWNFFCNLMNGFYRKSLARNYFLCQRLLEVRLSECRILSAGCDS